MSTAPDTEERVANPAITYTITPERLGRNREPEPFDVALPQHYRPTAQVLAERIYKYVKPFLLSKDFEVVVDMRKQTFTIEHGRFGRGRFEETGD